MYNPLTVFTLCRFLPRLAKSALEQSLEEAGIIKPEPTSHSIDSIEKSITCKYNLSQHDHPGI